MINLERLLGPNYQIIRQWWVQLIDPIINVHHVRVYLTREGWLAILFRPVRVRLFQRPRMQDEVVWDVIQRG